LLVAASILTVRTSGLGNIVYTLHNGYMVSYYISSVSTFENFGEIGSIECTMRRQSAVEKNKKCYWPHPPLQYRQVGYRILSIVYILVTWKPIIIPV
jgi:hypothetical protein